MPCPGWTYSSSSGTASSVTAVAPRVVQTKDVNCNIQADAFLIAKIKVDRTAAQLQDSLNVESLKLTNKQERPI